MAQIYDLSWLDIFSEHSRKMVNTYFICSMIISMNPRNVNTGITGVYRDRSVLLAVHEQDSKT